MSDHPDEWDDKDGPGMICPVPECRDTWQQGTIEEYQGEIPHGGMVRFLDDDDDRCPSCGTPGRYVRGEENGFFFDEEEYDQQGDEDDGEPAPIGA